ncbi:MAG TPA: ABC transporter permease, partial [Cyclobacteriaceae bacterium]|nr:ABC transporter permease [Cyclobacteriaceae bacterium]
MLKHNLLLIYRNFLRAKGFFLINLVGLTTGLVCTLLIYLWVRDEVNMDKFHAKDSRLFQVMEFQNYADEIMTTTSTPGILAETLKEEVPEVEYAATTTWISKFTLSVKENNVKADGFYVGEDFFNIFSYPLIEGNPDMVLKDKTAIVISRELAKKLFNTDENVIGKTVEWQHKKSYQVTGLFDKVTSSSYQFDFVLSFEDFKDTNEWVTSWGNNGPPSFLILREGSDAAAVSDKIKDFVKKKNTEGESNVTLFLKPYSERYLYGRYENGKQSGGRIEYVRLFSIIAVFILVIACINFMNLSTARASRRAKEVGIKKSIGAQRQSLIFQYISESMVTSLLSLLVAIAVVWMFLPAFNIITDKKIVLTLNDPQLLAMLLGVTVFTGLLAGSYPALFLSGFKPAAVLKGELKGSWGELWARKGLVVFQFALSVILIVSVLVIYKQIEFVQSRNLGYKKDNLISIPIEGKVESSLETFLTEVKRIPGVSSASSMGHDLIGRNNNTSGLEWDGKNPEDEILFENVRVNYDMLETLGVEMAEGRTFSREHSTDTSKIIFNEAAIRVMNMEDPVGKVIKLWDQYDLEIIGVVKDFNFQSLHDVVNPLFFMLDQRNTWNVMIRLEGGKEKETLKALTDFYKEYNPGFSFEYTFQDQEYAKQYAAEQRVATLSGYFAAFAILISCLGLFGLATFTAERRLKEIGIRKALGSSSTNIVMLLSGDFTRMVLLSILIGLPVSYWLLNGWLERFAFHIDLEIWYFAAAGLIALLIAWLTVASQAIKAAMINPVKCLRS